jgi:hypothetical protein
MTQKMFIRRIKKLHNFDVRSVMRTLDRPVGSEPQQRLKDLSKWFHSLTRNERARVEQVIELAVHHGIFDVLAILDGARIKGDSDNGTLELVYRCGRKCHILAGPRQGMLNTIYHRQVYERVFGS